MRRTDTNHPTSAQILTGLLVVVAGMPVLWPGVQPPIITLVQQLAAIAALGAVLMAAGWAAAQPRPTATAWGPVVLGAAALAGIGSALIAVLQVWAPAWVENGAAGWVAPSHLPGRAVGHVRQPNHLATLVLWGAAAWIAWVASRRIHQALAWLGMGLLMTGVVLSGSRTGLLGVGVLALWGLFDRSLPRICRTLLMATPLLCVLAWWLSMQWTHLVDLPLGGGGSLNPSSGDISSSRFGIWRNTWALIQAHPWTGVGWGQFNLAWSLSPMENRPGAFFDHAHNLPLHLMVELGIPAGALLSLGCAALLMASVRQAWRSHGADGPWRRAAAAMLVLVALHSQLEYPLWYAYFLVGTVGAAWVVWAPAESVTGSPSPSPWRWIPALQVLAGVTTVVMTTWAAFDYQRIRAIYHPPPEAAPLAQRMAAGQANTWFADHAHYAVATNRRAPSGQPWPPDLEQAWRHAPHLLVDTRLMLAWAQALETRDAPGDRDKARHLAQRLREFKHRESQAWLDACKAQGPAQADSPDSSAVQLRSEVRVEGAVSRIPCEAPTRALDWKDFLED